MFYRLPAFMLFLVCCTAQTGFTQPVWPGPEAEQMYLQARQHMSSGNVREAVIAYRQLLPLAPDVMEPYRDLGRLYYLSGSYEAAYKTLSSIIDKNVADDQSYQTAAASLDALGSRKKALSLLRQGIVRYPRSGLLYNELGKQHEAAGDKAAALGAWIEGIEADPQYRLNYYEAARAYSDAGAPVWTIVYGEIFHTFENQTPRAADVRRMVLDAYKALFMTRVHVREPEAYGRVTGESSAGGFEDAVHQTYTQLAPVIRQGFTAESLIMLRTRFLIDWQRNYAGLYPFALFEWQYRLISEGNFDAYNQWLLGTAADKQSYDSWNTFHKEAVPGMHAWIRQYPFQPVSGQFYNDKNLKKLFSTKNRSKR